MLSFVKEDNKVIISVFIAALLWYCTFAIKILNFWVSMSLAAGTIGVLAIILGGNPFQRKHFNLRALLIGIISAVVLYIIFFLGNFISGYLFDFASKQVASIYNIRHEGKAQYILFILLFITSPAEEIYWRGFLQKWSMQRFGKKTGWILAALIYSAVHICSGNFMLVMAALVAGLFWGYIYMMENNVTSLIISHALWIIGVFVLFPFSL